MYRVIMGSAKSGHAMRQAKGIEQDRQFQGEEPRLAGVCHSSIHVIYTYVMVCAYSTKEMRNTSYMTLQTNIKSLVTDWISSQHPPTRLGCPHMVTHLLLTAWW